MSVWHHQVWNKWFSSLLAMTPLHGGATNGLKVSQIPIVHKPLTDGGWGVYCWATWAPVQSATSLVNIALVSPYKWPHAASTISSSFKFQRVWLLLSGASQIMSCSNCISSFCCPWGNGTHNLKSMFCIWLFRNGSCATAFYKQRTI